MGKISYLFIIFYIVISIPLFSQSVKKDSFNITKTLSSVKVQSSKAIVQHVRGKIIVNVDASVTNAGASVLEVLEKSPGVIVGKNGALSLQGKSGVLVLIDDKPTYLSEADLNNLLESMSSSQVDQIELIANPPAKYEAKGNAGVINIKTKKLKQEGLNGNLTTSFGMGRFPKSNNSLSMNFRKGKINSYLTLTSNFVKGFTDYYAERHYIDNNGTLINSLIQPTDYNQTNTNNTIKTAIEYYVSPKVTMGLQFTGVTITKPSEGYSSATWANHSGNVDSVLLALSNSKTKFNNTAINLSGKYLVRKNEVVSMDLDALHYNLHSDQLFNNYTSQSGVTTFGSKGTLPSVLNIYSIKADHVLSIGKEGKMENGFKSSMINTDNVASYQISDGSQWSEDYGKSNHFIYKENINAVYSSFEERSGKISWQSGIRFENTHYDAHQLGNAERKDSAFSNNYSGFFPSGYVSYKADTFNTFTFTAGRRIDRPAFQKLNPFVTLFNKYTYNKGNPYYRPQYSWNMELSHQYKQWLSTSISYSIIKDYFSQLFLSEGNSILVYTEGNVGRMYNIGASLGTQVRPFHWWMLSTQVIYNYKNLKGYKNVNYSSEVSQFNISVSNQFHLNGTLTGEVSGFYTSKARNDIQELLLPTGELSAGISKTALKNKGTFKLSIRDILNSNTMSGNTDFPNATEFFIVRQDKRVLNFSFSYRFGKVLKSVKSNSGSVKDEVQRVGNG